MDKQLSYYVHCFTHLKRDAKNGGAPHKPILLLSIIKMYELSYFENNQIQIIPELVASFKSNWTQLVESNHFPIFALPFYHMNSEPFWDLIANPGCEKWIESKSSMRSLKNLTTAVNYACLDDELVAQLIIPVSREILKNSILKRYFPNYQLSYNSTYNDDLPSASILNEPSVEYRKKISELQKSLDENTFQEEVFIRGGLFKREIPKIYNNTCAISGLRVDALTNVSMVDACHIVPFSQGYDDTLKNGIALCPNLHRAFDRGLISISNEYKVLVNENFTENNSVFNLSQFQGKKIILPTKEAFFPDLENLFQHRQRFNF